MSTLTMHVSRLSLTSGAARSASQRPFATTGHAKQATTPNDGKDIDIDQLLSRPTWSVSSLLPRNTDSEATQVSSKQLRHLMKLSALPPPKDDSEEAKMLKTLSSQLHFVQEIQKADTTGVRPLQSLRDETAQGEQENELGLEALKEALAAEEVRGKFHPRVRRRRDGAVAARKDEWNVLGTAGKKTGRYFVVEGGK